MSHVNNDIISENYLEWKNQFPRKVGICSECTEEKEIYKCLCLVFKGKNYCIKCLYNYYINHLTEG